MCLQRRSLFLSILALSVPLASNVHAGGGSQLVSSSAGGGVAAGTSERPALSADGSIVAFESTAADLAPGDTNGVRDIFVLDLDSGALVVASVDSAGVQANGPSQRAALSADGRLVSFTSAASNLVAGDTNGLVDVFVHDCATGATRRVSLSSTAAQANGACDHPALSGDGRYVAFQSEATNLVAGDTNAVADVFVHDLVTGATQRVSVATGGAQSDAVSEWPTLSHDGRYVGFASLATTLAVTGPSWDVFRRDRTLGVTLNATFGSGHSRFPSLSADGQRMSFQSEASNLVAFDTNGVQDVFVQDFVAGTRTRASVSDQGDQANAASFLSRISPDGSQVAFRSAASNLVLADTNAVDDVFLRALGPQTTQLVSVGDAGQLGDDFASRPAISAGGAAVAFESRASNLVAGDSNAATDVFRWSRMPLCWYVDASAAGPGDGSQADPFALIQDALGSPFVLSGDCVRVAPGSYAENLVFGGKALDLEGTGGAAVTIVDGGDLGPTATLAPSAGSTRLAGLTLTGGAALNQQFAGDGGGIWADGVELLIEGCAIVDNNQSFTASRGSGVFAQGCTLSVTDTEIARNELGICPNYGGGLCLIGGSLTADNLSVNDHPFADFGAAAYFENADASLTACTFEGNSPNFTSFSRGKAVCAIGMASAVNVEGCSFLDNGDDPFNSAGVGGALYLDVATASVRDSLFERNVATYPGGGAIYSGGQTALTVEDTTFRNNVADGGGALTLEGSSADVSGCSFLGNGTSYDAGAAIRLFAGSLALDGCEFVGNQTGPDCYPAGAIDQGGGSLTADGCSFVGNVANQSGAVRANLATFRTCSFLENQVPYCFFGTGNGAACEATANTVFEQCVFWRNKTSGGGFAGASGGAVFGPATLDRCTVVENEANAGPYGTGGGGGVWNAAVASSIVLGNLPDQLAGTASATYSIIEGGAPGVGNLNADPKFWLPGQGDFHLQAGSPAIDAGSPAAPLDPDGTRADMGALPYDPSYCPEPIPYCMAAITSGGCTAQIDSTGTLSYSGPVNFHVTASGAPNNKPGLMIWGVQEGAILFGTGTLCITPPIARTAIQFSGGSPMGNDCSGSFDLLLQPAVLQNFQIQPGQAVFAQYWFRDPGQAPPNNFALSNALAIGVCP